MKTVSVKAEHKILIMVFYTIASTGSPGPSVLFCGQPVTDITIKIYSVIVGKLSDLKLRLIGAKTLFKK